MSDWVVVILRDWDDASSDVSDVMGPMSESEARARADAHNEAIAAGWKTYREQWEAWHRRRVDLFGQKHPLSAEELVELGPDPGNKGPEDADLRAVAMPLSAP